MNGRRPTGIARHAHHARPVAGETCHHLSAMERRRSCSALASRNGRAALGILGDEHAKRAEPPHRIGAKPERSLELDHCWRDIASSGTPAITTTSRPVSVITASVGHRVPRHQKLEHLRPYPLARQAVEAGVQRDAGR